MNVRASTFLILSLFGAFGRAEAQALIQVPAQGTLQQAFTNVTDGGTIEISAGTYNVPAGGFNLVNYQKRITVRAVSSGTVTLNGAGSPIIRIANTSLASSKPITFEGITFSGGVSAATSVGGAMTLSEAEVTLSACTFTNNSAPIVNGGGGAIIAYRSRALIVDSRFDNNWAQRYGGAIGIDMGNVAIHNTRFTGNRVNRPNHFADSLGGALFVLNSALRVTNSRFDSNEAGFSGGAIYSYGTWTDPVAVPRTDMVIANTTFINNRTIRDPGSPAFNDTDTAGALQLEDQVRARVYNSRFITNNAKQGGAVANYRSKLEIYSSTFQGNFARGNVGGEGTGGAIVLVSEDQDAPDPQRPNAETLIRDTLLQGRYGSVGIAARLGGCLFSVGDTRRAYGLGGIPQMGTIAQNRTVLDIRRTAFVDCDVQENAGGGVGGGMEVQLTDLTLQDSLFIGCDAVAGASFTGTGGALAAFDNSKLSILRTTFAQSTASLSGGALWVQGTEIAMSDSQVFENRIVGPNPWSGSAMFSAPENLGAPRPAVNVTGRIENTVFSNNSGGSMLLDYDSASAPHNLVQYANNRFFPNNATVYSNPLAPSAQTVAQLNSLVVNGTAKSPTANTGLASVPVLGAIAAAPTTILTTLPPGDPAGPTPAYVSIAWSGGNATLDGGGVGGGLGVVAAGAGNHVLNVAGTPYSASIVTGAVPASRLSASPPAIPIGGSSTLSWTTLAGTFVDEFIDQSVGPPSPTTAGSIGVGPLPSTTRYRGLLVAQEGGYIATTSVIVGNDLIFRSTFEQ